jgi:DNA-binding NtrC family response regulator
VLEDGTYRPVGSQKVERATARIIAATNKDLEAEAVTGGLFREDLFYRLNIVSICMPPLRERAEDIASLVKTFTDHFCTKHRRRPKKFKAEVVSLFQTLRWPGNVRQLRNLVERLVVTVPHAAIGLDDLSPSMHQGKREPHAIAIQPGMTLAQVEAELIRQTLLKVTSNREEAAKTLGISRRALQYKIQRYKLDKLPKQVGRSKP